MRTLALSVLLIVAAAACSEPGCVRLDGATELLEAPYPREHRSSNDPPNRVVRMLEPGEYRYADEHFGKDFLAYEIRLRDGIRGYVIHGAGVSQCR